MSDICAYCGSKDEISRDHVPPKSLFSKPRPDNLITVPSCIECNIAASEDDEYFRLMLSMRHDTFEHPDIQKTWEKIYRGLKRKSYPGLKKFLLSSIRKADLVSKSGLYLGKVATYDVDLERMSKVASRISKGLFYHHNDYRLPDEYFCESYAIEGFKGYQPEIVEKLSKFYTYVREAELNVLGKNVFTYRIRFLEDTPDFGVIAMAFYDQVHFITLFGNEKYKKNEA